MPQRRATAPPIDMDELRDDVEAWFSLRRSAKTLDTKLGQLKKRLQTVLQKYGETDPNTGSVFLKLGEPIGDERIAEMKNQCATATGLNYEAAQEILTEKGLWEEMTEVVREVDQAKVHAAFFDKRITKDELDQMFPTRISYSFWLLDDMGKQIR